MPATRTRKRRRYVRAEAGDALRTYEEIREELFRRHGWKMSTVRVQQLCTRAEAKLRRRLIALLAEL
jgi:hypothetical protein